MTGHHDGCVIEYENWVVKDQMIRCECECHGPKPPAGPDSKQSVSGRKEGRTKKDSGSAPSRPDASGQEEPRVVRGKSNSANRKRTSGK